MIERILRQKIEGMIGSEKAVIIMGPRQVGKSTLLHEMFGASQDVLWLNGDEPDVQELFANWKIQCKLPPKTKRFCPLVLK